MKLQMLEKCLTVASALAAIVSAAIMCGQVVAPQQRMVLPSPQPARAQQIQTEHTIQPCVK